MMGMDIYGRHPTNKDGEYFRNTIFEWMPLLDYITKALPTLVPDDAWKTWAVNLGHGLDATSSQLLGQAIADEVASGHAAAWVDARKAKLKASGRTMAALVEPLRKRILRQPAEWGFRDSEFFVNLSKRDDEAFNRFHQALTAKVMTPAGRVADDFPTVAIVANAERFGRFLESSGGFEIR